MKGLDGRFAGDQIQGDRNYQEDDFGLFDGRTETGQGDEHSLMILADGMGGHTAGARASKVAVSSFVEEYHDLSGPLRKRLNRAMQYANSGLESAIKEEPELAGMGCTLVGALITSEGLQWVSVGDSPLWIYRSGEMLRINADHSMAPIFADMVAVGRMTELEAENEPKRHILRSALMGDQLSMVDLSDRPYPLRKGDVVVLASDGVETLKPVEIAQLLDGSSKLELDKVTSGLLNAVTDKAKPNQDNTTVLLYRVLEDSSKALDDDEDLTVEVPLSLGTGGSKEIDTPTQPVVVPLDPTIPNRPAVTADKAEKTVSWMPIVGLLIAIIALLLVFLFEPEPVSVSSPSVPTQLQFETEKATPAEAQVPSIDPPASNIMPVEVVEPEAQQQSLAPAAESPWLPEQTDTLRKKETKGGDL